MKKLKRLGNDWGRVGGGILEALGQDEVAEDVGK